MSSVSVEMTYHGHQSETQAMQVRFLVKPRAMRAYSQKIPPEPEICRTGNTFIHGATDLVASLQPAPAAFNGESTVVDACRLLCLALRVLAPNACHRSVKIEKIEGTRCQKQDAYISRD